ncbi:MAG: hypothetical protein Q9174_003999 [Haloplaca sp. 1 TL-2023]
MTTKSDFMQPSAPPSEHSPKTENLESDPSSLAPGSPVELGTQVFDKTPAMTARLPSDIRREINTLNAQIKATIEVTRKNRRRLESLIDHFEAALKAKEERLASLNDDLEAALEAQRERLKQEEEATRKVEQNGLFKDNDLEALTDMISRLEESSTLLINISTSKELSEEERKEKQIFELQVMQFLIDRLGRYDDEVLAARLKKLDPKAMNLREPPSLE